MSAEAKKNPPKVYANFNFTQYVHKLRDANNEPNKQNLHQEKLKHVSKKKTTKKAKKMKTTKQLKKKKIVHEGVHYKNLRVIDTTND